MPERFDISVILCTRNRASQLARTLESFQHLEFDGTWELVIVDNGSTDNTPRIIQAFADTTPLQIQLLREATPGLSRARNRGLSHAYGEIIAFTDDDCYPEKNYLTAIQAAFSKPELSFVGGQVLLFDPSDMKISVIEEARRKEIGGGIFLPSAVIMGANMAFRRRTLMDLQGFDERVGVGTFFGSGEDVDVLRRAISAKLRGAFDPGIRVYHHHGRKTPMDASRLRRAYDRGIGAVFAKFILNSSTRTLYLKNWYWYSRGIPWHRRFRQIGYGVLFTLRYGAVPGRVWNHPHQSLTQIDLCRESIRQ